jgi:hypothetical protein
MIGGVRGFEIVGCSKLARLEQRLAAKNPLPHGDNRGGSFIFE